MFSGAGTPINDKLLQAGANLANAVSESLKSKKTAATDTTVVNGTTTDSVDIRPQQDVSRVETVKASELGRGVEEQRVSQPQYRTNYKTGADDARSQFANAKEEIAYLRGEARNLPPPPAADNVRKVIAEIEKHFQDDDRIPPSLFNTVKDLIAKSLEGDDDGHNGTLDKLA